MVESTVTDQGCDGDEVQERNVCLKALLDVPAGEVLCVKLGLLRLPPIEFNTSCAYPQKDQPDDKQVSGDNYH